MTLSSLTLYGPNATWWARGLGIVGGALFALCLGLLACDFPLEKLFAEKSPATVGNGATCRTHFDELLRSTANASDKSSILGVWPTEVRLAGRLCLVVTGIASKGSESQLVATLNEKKYGADRAKQRYDSAVSAATNARQELANAEAKANVAEREKAPDVEQLRASALKLAADSDEKEKLRTAAFDALTVANKAYEDAAAEANRGAPVVDVTLFLNERRTPLIAKAMATSGPQLLTYEFGQIADANTDDAKFWRDLVARNTKWGAMPLSIGISRSQSTVAEQTAPKIEVNLRVYWLSIALIGGSAMILLVAAFVIFAANSAILRDSNLMAVREYSALADVRTKAAAAKAAADAAPGDETLKAQASKTADAMEKATRDASYPSGTFSLGRCQMALWLGLTTVGFIFIWLTLGLYRNVVTDAVLVLLGINSATGLAAMVIDGPAGSQASPTQGFLRDLTSDGKSPALHRIQVLIWTCILALIFAWNAATDFLFVDFDTKLLLLMGIASSTYLGFKTQEPPPAPPK